MPCIRDCTLPRLSVDIYRCGESLINIERLNIQHEVINANLRDVATPARRDRRRKGGHDRDNFVILSRNHNCFRMCHLLLPLGPGDYVTVTNENDLLEVPTISAKSVLESCHRRILRRPPSPKIDGESA